MLSVHQTLMSTVQSNVAQFRLRFHRFSAVILLYPPSLLAFRN